MENHFGGITDTWLHNINKFENGIADKYFESFYWAIATFLLVGSKGDTFAETIYCIITLVITIPIFGFILSTIG